MGKKYAIPLKKKTLVILKILEKNDIENNNIMIAICILQNHFNSIIIFNYRICPYFISLNPTKIFRYSHEAV